MRGALEHFSPIVVMASLDEAYLDFAGTDRLHPVSLLPIAEQIRDAGRQDTGLDCSVGIGPNRMVAKLASDYAKPRGLMEVRAGWEEGFLAGRVREKLGFDAVTPAKCSNRKRAGDALRYFQRRSLSSNRRPTTPAGSDT